MAKAKKKAKTQNSKTKSPGKKNLKVVKTKKAAPKKAASKKTAPKKAATKKAAPNKAIAKKSAAKKSVAKTKVAKTTKNVKAAAPQKPVAPKTTPKKAATRGINIQPLADRLIVRPEGPSEKTAGGLYIPAMVEDRPSQGEVLAAGQGSKNRKGNLKPLDVRKGDFVLFNAHAGVKTLIDGQDLLILREEDVLGVVSR